MKKQLLTFGIRWLANMVAIWISGQVFGLIGYQHSVFVIIVGGLVLSLLNVLLKPLIVIFTLPAIALSQGFFLIVINGVIVYLASLISPLTIDSFWSAVLVGIVVGLVNYTVTIIAEAFTKDHA
jgi:putative membrane protein